MNELGAIEATPATEIMVDGKGHFIESVDKIEICDCVANFENGKQPLYRAVYDSVKSVPFITEIKNRRFILIIRTSQEE